MPAERSFSGPCALAFDGELVDTFRLRPVCGVRGGFRTSPGSGGDGYVKVVGVSALSTNGSSGPRGLSRRKLGDDPGIGADKRSEEEDGVRVEASGYTDDPARSCAAVKDDLPLFVVECDLTERGMRTIFIVFAMVAAGVMFEKCKSEEDVGGVRKPVLLAALSPLVLGRYSDESAYSELVEDK